MIKNMRKAGQRTVKKQGRMQNDKKEIENISENWAINNMITQAKNWTEHRAESIDKKGRKQ